MDLGIATDSPVEEDDKRQPPRSCMGMGCSGFTSVLHFLEPSSKRNTPFGLAMSHAPP